MTTTLDRPVATRATALWTATQNALCLVSGCSTAFHRANGKACYHAPEALARLEIRCAVCMVKAKHRRWGTERDEQESRDGTQLNHGGTNIYVFRFSFALATRPRRRLDVVERVTCRSQMIRRGVVVAHRVSSSLTVAGVASASCRVRVAQYGAPVAPILIDSASARLHARFAGHSKVRRLLAWFLCLCSV